MPSIKYTADPQADLVLQTADGTSFRVRRKYLDAASDVFESMLASSTDVHAEKDAETGLAVVKLAGEERVVEMDMVLRSIVRDQVRPDLTVLGVAAASR